MTFTRVVPRTQGQTDREEALYISFQGSLFFPCDPSSISDLLLPVHYGKKHMRQTRGTCLKKGNQCFLLGRTASPPCYQTKLAVHGIFFFRLHCMKRMPYNGNPRPTYEYTNRGYSSLPVLPIQPEETYVCPGVLSRWS